MKREEFYQKVLAKLKSSESIEDFHFEISGVKCFVSRNIYPKSEFLAGISGHATGIHHIDSIRGCLGGFPAHMYKGDAPTSEIIATAICDCARREF